MAMPSTRMQIPERKVLSKRAVAAPAAGISGIFGFVGERDRELLERERIRRELVAERFNIDAVESAAAKPRFTEKVARLLRLS